MPLLTYLLQWLLCSQSPLHFPHWGRSHPSGVPGAEQALPVPLEMKVRGWGVLCVYLLCRMLVLSVLLSQQKKVTGKPEIGTSFKGGFGLNGCCGKADRVNLCLRRIPWWQQGGLEKGFEGLHSTSLLHLDWWEFLGSILASLVFYRCLLWWRTVYWTFLWNLEVSVAAAVLGSWLSMCVLPL